MELAIIVRLNERAYLDSVNQGLDENEWKVTCIQFAPNDPEQNPVEGIWLYAKRFVREFYHLCKSFAAVKRLFELITHHQIFDRTYAVGGRESQGAAK
jgi:transposase